MNINAKQIFGLVVRYLFLVLLVFSGYNIIYFILGKVTIYPSLWLLKLVYHSTSLLPGTNTLFVSGYYIDIIEACIAVAAYYLLLFLNLTTHMTIQKRVKSIIFLVFSFLILNVLRIVIFSIFFLSGYAFFSVAHTITWYIGSTLLVAFIWFVNAWMFKIREIPVYSDIISLIRKAKRKV